MKRLLVQTVGTGGENNPVWDALAFTIRQVRPDHVLWLCSEKTKADTLPRVEQQCRDLQFTRDVRVGSDADHVGRLLEEYLREIEQLRRAHHDAVFSADFTSGTKAMSGALVAAAMIAGISTIHYATGPRDASGRATRTERSDAMDVTPLVAARELPELGSLFDRGQFVAVQEGAARLLDRLSDGEARQRAQTLVWLARALEPWSRFDFKAAKALLKPIVRPERLEILRRAGWSVDWIQRAHVHLDSCILNSVGSAAQQRRITLEWLVDLYQNAERCCDWGRYDDCVARCYRLTEAIGQYIVQGEPFNLKSTKGSDVTESFRSKYGIPENTGDLGLRQVHSAILKAAELCELSNQNLVDFSRQATSWKSPLQPRNDSPLAHGFDPIGAENARKILAFVRGGLLALIGDALGSLSEAATFPKCPWPVSTAASPQLHLD